VNPNGVVEKNIIGIVPNQRYTPFMKEWVVPPQDVHPERKTLGEPYRDALLGSARPNTVHDSPREHHTREQLITRGFVPGMAELFHEGGFIRGGKELNMSTGVDIQTG